MGYATAIIHKPITNHDQIKVTDWLIYWVKESLLKFK